MDIGTIIDLQCKDSPILKVLPPLSLNKAMRTLVRMLLNAKEKQFIRYPEYIQRLRNAYVHGDPEGFVEVFKEFLTIATLQIPQMGKPDDVPLRIADLKALIEDYTFVEIAKKLLQVEVMSIR